MLKGKTITLRTVRERDLDVLYEFHEDIGNRGEYYPLGVLGEPRFKRDFQESGLWGNDEGTLLIVDAEDSILGHVEYFRTVSYLDELELGYQLYSTEHAGQGIATEAVQLITGYLFGAKKFNRSRLMIHPENVASRRVAEKCGYRHESTARGAWFHRGRWHDAEVYALLREEYYDSVPRPERL